MRAILVPAALPLACAQAQACGHAPAPVVAAAPEAPRVVSAPQSEPDRQLAGAVCRARGCRVAGEEAAGADAQGHKLAVVKVLPTGVEPRRAACAPIEYWAVTRDAGRVVSAKRALSIGCDANVIADEVRVGDNQLERLRTGGSTVRWHGRTLLRLSPLVTRLDERHAWSTTSPNFESTSWSMEDFAGSVAWYSPHCARGGSAPAASGAFAELGERRARYEYVPIPIVAIDESFRTTRWKQAHLGKCAALASPTASSGFVLKGPIGSEADGFFKVVASREGELFIDIRDDRWLAGAKRRDAKREDEVELWLGGELPSFERPCLRGLAPLTSFNVRVSDGEVTPGFGKPDARQVARVTVERSAQTFGDTFGWVHLKVRLGSLPPSLTVVYRDGDGGRAADRVFATSKLTPGDAATLGAFTVLPRETICRVRDGALEPD